MLRGYPRVYAISLIMVAYTDSLVDFDTLARFVQAYQRVNPLLIGELWAVAITLRIVLFEQLRLLAVRLGDTMTQLQRANKIADELLLMVSKPSITASDIVAQLSSNLGPQQELHRTLIVQLAQRLRDQDPIIRPAFTWSVDAGATGRIRHPHRCLASPRGRPPQLTVPPPHLLRRPLVCSPSSCPQAGDAAV